jgi:cell shape-determining protein MreD
MISKLISKSDTTQISKYLVFTFVFMLFCAFETSFWPNLIGFIPAPQFWLVFVFYVCVRWSERWNIFFLYFLGFVVTLYSMMPLKMAWFSLLFVFAIIYFFKNRIHSASVVTFSLLSLAMSVVYAIIYVVLSQIFENNPTTLIPVERLICFGLNFLVSVPIYWFLERLNSFFKTDIEVNENKTIKNITPVQHDL